MTKFINPKIAIIAGTPTDTAFGKKFLETFFSGNIESFSVASSPDEQNNLQLNNPLQLYEICLNKCLAFKANNIEKVLIYCNSLSSSINISQLEAESGIQIITPLTVYKKINHKYNKILIIAANATGCIMPEKIIRKRIPDADITTIGYLALVESIERLDKPSTIFQTLAIKNILDFAQNTNTDLIILACTHFPYLTNVINKNTNIKIIDLNQGLTKLLI